MRMVLPWSGVSAAIVAAQCGGAEAAPAGNPSGLTLRLAPALGAMVAVQEEPPPHQGPVPKAVKPFASQDSWRWYCQWAVGPDISGATTIYLVGGGISYFIVDDLSLDAELNGLFVDQTGDDAAGINLAFLARFHFLKRERWTMYADVGCGLLGTTAEVPGPSPEEPSGGTRFNFTPQAGIGFTYQIEADMRLMVGVRWYHISNAQSWSDNPGFNSILLYAGVSVPF